MTDAVFVRRVLWVLLLIVPPHSLFVEVAMRSRLGTSVMADWSKMDRDNNGRVTRAEFNEVYRR